MDAMGKAALGRNGETNTMGQCTELTPHPLRLALFTEKASSYPPNCRRGSLFNIASRLGHWISFMV
jgi:hypothetical protein